MKRIGIDAHVLTGKFQGSRTYLKNTLEEIAKLDTVNRYLLYSFDPEVTRKMLPFENFEHHELTVRARIPRILFYWPYVQKRDGLDYLVTHYSSPLYPSKKQLLFIYDVLFETHPQYFSPGFVLRNRTYTRLSAKRARVIFTISEFSRQQIMDRYGIVDSKIVNLRGGVNGGMKLRPKSPTQDIRDLKPYLLFVGRLEPRKNLSTLISAFEKMEQTDIKLVLVGAGDFDFQEVMDKIANNENIIHKTDVDDEQLKHYYANATGFVYPSFAEGLGLPILEALAYGLPVITSNSTALLEAGGDLVKYFDPYASNSVKALAELMATVTAQPKRPEPSAVETHLQKFQWQKTAQVFVDKLVGLE